MLITPPTLPSTPGFQNLQDGIARERKHGSDSSSGLRASVFHGNPYLFTAAALVWVGGIKKLDPHLSQAASQEEKELPSFEFVDLKGTATKKQKRSAEEEEEEEEEDKKDEEEEDKEEEEEEDKEE